MANVQKGHDNNCDCVQVKGKRVFWWETHGPLFSLFSSHLSLNHSSLSPFPSPLFPPFSLISSSENSSSCFFFSSSSIFMFFIWSKGEFQVWRQVLLGLSPSKERQVLLASLLLCKIYSLHFDVQVLCLIPFILVYILLSSWLKISFLLKMGLSFYL